MSVKILYVEDEVFLGKIVSESLEQRGYQIKWVTDGADVMQSLTSAKPDICILDVMLPHINGFDLGSQIRKLHPALPIIYLTAKDQTEDVLKGFASGGNDYIRKPFSIEELIVRIENLMKGQPTAGLSDAPTQLGDLQFSPRKMELITPTESIRLSHRESELLKILVEHQNLPIERKVILKQLWGDDSFFNSRNLDVYITKLRKHLKADPRIEIITLKGVGYQFIVR
jgi:DNA-binding response OmpR family regulator